MNHANALDWQSQIENGRRYLKTACNGQKRPAVFTPELIYQLTAMAIEKLLAGIYQYHHQMPEDHTLAGLVDGLVPLCPLEKEVADRIKAMAAFDDMCSLLPCPRHIPNAEELAAILMTARDVAAFALQQVGTTEGPVQ